MVNTYRHPRSERGLALIVSLVLLVVSSVIAVAALSGTRLSERIAGNAQQKAIAFEAAESSVELGFQRDEVLAALPGSSISTDASEVVFVPMIKASLQADYDQSRAGPAGTPIPSVNVEGELTIQFCGETPVPRGTSLSANLDDSSRMVGILFDVNGVATVDGSATKADHVQRGYLAGPATGRGGSCITR